MQRTIEYYMSFPVIAIVAAFTLLAIENWIYHTITGKPNKGEFPWERQ